HFWDLRNDLLKNELFYRLAEGILADQFLVVEHLNKLDFKKKNTNEELLRAVLEAKSLMDARIVDPMSLDFLARQVGISKYHLIRLFKQVLGITPYQYQQKIRLEQARDAIREGMDVSTAAFVYGFTEVSAFSKAFKKRFGASPGFLRKSNF
ncbi:MAG: helix-turn-helix domain-containing protein, partial [Bacteroidota bacterium]